MVAAVCRHLRNSRKKEKEKTGIERRTNEGNKEGKNEGDKDGE
jgi:hypothetical protein